MNYLVFLVFFNFITTCCFMGQIKFFDGYAQPVQSSLRIALLLFMPQYNPLFPTPTPSFNYFFPKKLDI